ncbi:hypothetical protein TSAR_004158 [Trichomalopsis sarcophagae]|uniref:Mon2 C-terminal domain-containing protein n=1 Tax=Trichomalopsis sarcophagae TaxID=543379 RepID=A0A232FAY9_9HYME|nr:hypothetical protein TSAR_004158 [Trichomalopsis sarcophagae]
MAASPADLPSQLCFMDFKRYIEDKRRSGKCPLPRLSEISSILKAIATLVISLKKAPANKVERSVWEQLIDLYPCLVESTVVTASNQVSRSLREALMQYHDLLLPPSNINPPTSNGV